MSPTRPWGTSRRRLVAVGITAAAIAATAAGASYALTSPVYSSADELAHVDYAFRVWHGELPVFEDRLVVRPDFGFVPPVHWVSQHPPLYYVLQAPVVGPLLDAGHPLQAGFAGRGLNAVLAAVLVVAVAWSVAQISPTRPERWIVAALVTAANTWVVRIGGSIYNDLLAAILATLLLGLTVRILRRGPSARLYLSLAVTAAAALLSRASLAVVLLACLAVLAADAVLSTRSPRRALPSLAALVLVGLAPVASSGWFWLRNLRLTGRVTGGSPDWAIENLGRQTSPWWEIALSERTWRRLLAQYGYGLLDQDLVTMVLVVAPILLAAGALVAKVFRGSRATVSPQPDATDLSVAMVLLTTTILVCAMQVGYTSGTGGLNARYLLLLATPLGLGIASGLTVGGSRKIPSLMLMTCWVAVATGEFVARIAQPVVQAEVITRPSAPTFPVAGSLTAAIAVSAMTVAVLAAAHVRNRSGSSEESPDENG